MDCAWRTLCDQASNTSNRAAQALKSPPALFLSAMDAALRLSRAAQKLYEQSVDTALGIARDDSPPLSTQAASVRDALSGLIAFVVPGADAYSLAQGVSTSEPGGLDAGILPVVTEVLNRTQPGIPGGPPASVFVAGALDQFAGQVNPSAQGLFASPFANLSFTEKGRVFRAIEGNPQTRPLVGVLALVAFLTYSEAPVLDPRTRTLRARPLGWTLSGYKGVADGRADFKGYYQDRMHVETRPDLAWR